MREILSEIIDPAIEKLLTYTKAESKVNIAYSEYLSSSNRKLYGMAKGQIFIGCIGIELISAGIGEIRHIAVSPSERGKKTASRMIEFVCREHSLQTITAETDEDAVGFYKAYRFEVTSLGEKYPGVERFHCTYKNPSFL